MRRPGFLEGAGVALSLAGIGAVGLFTLSALFAGPFLIRWLVMMIAGLYVIYLLARSPHRAGRLASASIWLAGALAVWFLSPSFAWFAALHVMLIWLLRTLYFHSSFVGAAADLGLGAVSFAAAVAAANQTGSFFLAVWTFFLLQALFVVLPRAWRKDSSRAPRLDPDDGFDKASRAAELALRRISIQS